MKRRGFLGRVAAAAIASLSIAQSGKAYGTGDGTAATNKGVLRRAPDAETRLMTSAAPEAGHRYLYMSYSWPPLTITRPRDARGRFTRRSA